jgi:hypothetical protein
MIKSLAGSEESAEEMIELFLDRQGVDTRITDEIAIAAARKIRGEEGCCERRMRH